MFVLTAISSRKYQPGGGIKQALLLASSGGAPAPCVCAMLFRRPQAFF